MPLLSEECHDLHTTAIIIIIISSSSSSSLIDLGLTLTQVNEMLLSLLLLWLLSLML